MKICFIAPGEISVPPPGWGALETVVWNQYSNLKKIGYDVSIINEPDSKLTLEKINEINPDIVHLHYGAHYDIMPYVKCRKIVTNHDGSFLSSKNFHESVIRNFLYDCEFFILTTWEKDFLLRIGISPRKIKVLPNGVDFNAFNFQAKPKNQDSSICLGKIDKRKNQVFLQSLDSGIFFVGQNTVAEFNPLDSKYLGLWTRAEVYEKLTDYCNLVLISELELQPLVCLEALSAGLGLVISEAASQNLDSSLPFITIIPQDSIHDSEIVSSSISNNRKACANISREKIREYGKQFDWQNIIKFYDKHISNITNTEA
jgi:hypothetical protein